jgi:hypothetical protein
VRRPRHRGDYEIAPVMITWDTTVYLLVDLRRTRRAFACVPNSSARTFLYRLLHGQLDRILSAYLRAAPAGRVLGARWQTNSPGLYDVLGTRSELLAAEREPDPVAPPSLRDDAVPFAAVAQ